MEYRLNKIDLDIRQDINNETREGKVHSKKGIKVGKDKSEDRRGKKEQQEKLKEKFNLSKYVKSGKITVDAVKVENIAIQATKEDGQHSKDDNRGLFIDARK
jgi:hypothetical protein